MTAIKIGLVDLDTSHPENFVPIIRSMGHEVAAVFDSGAIHPAGYAKAFVDKFGIAAVCGTLEEMVPLVDAVLIHSCNWDVHIERAQPFIDAGKAVFIDKPLAGRVRHLRQMADWVANGALLTGGSALRYCREVAAWSGGRNEEDKWVYGLAGCSVDEFNYGIHAYSLLHGLLGSGIASVRHLGRSGSQRQVELTWSDGRQGVVSIGETAGYLPFYATVITERQAEHIVVDNAGLYKGLLEAVLPYLAGDAPAPVPFAALLEAEMAAIAAQRSAELGGASVRLDELPEDYAAYDGGVFEKCYKRLKYPAETE
ncbi:Gfo/Idh/MocA family oxidoreductase [Paenibacillus sp. GCM10027626]|uniref:Gfo/Idh/MocA family oxidoreductase n=1 Tax=Paenibacillus sp. GCM10027626 TaxID=3273411 RepID=UPI00362F59AD